MYENYINLLYIVSTITRIALVIVACKKIMVYYLLRKQTIYSLFGVFLSVLLIDRSVRFLSRRKKDGFSSSFSSTEP